jgi:hypothetical protein
MRASQPYDTARRYVTAVFSSTAASETLARHIYKLLPILLVSVAGMIPKRSYSFVLRALLC